MIIAQISDTHIDLDSPKGAARLGDFERCVAAIGRLKPLPDVVIHTGDIAHNGTPAEYKAARRILDALRCPFHVAVGNRDDRATLRTAFPIENDLLPDTPYVQYCVDSFPVRLIVLDTQSKGSNQGELCQARTDNLRAALAEAPAKPTAIFMHHPPFEVHESDYPVQFGAWESVERLRRALDGQQHVAGIFCGHTHRDAVGDVGGVPASSMPSVAVEMRLGRYPAEFRSSPICKVHRFAAGRGFVSEIRAV